jgi:hypothetical protein
MRHSYLFSQIVATLLRMFSPTKCLKKKKKKKKKKGGGGGGGGGGKGSPARRLSCKGLQTQLSSINSGTAGMKALFKPIGCIDLELLHNLQTVCCLMPSSCNLNIHNSNCKMVLIKKYFMWVSMLSVQWVSSPWCWEQLVWEKSWVVFLSQSWLAWTLASLLHSGFL